MIFRIFGGLCVSIVSLYIVAIVITLVFQLPPDFGPVDTFPGLVAVVPTGLLGFWFGYLSVKKFQRRRTQ